MHVPNLKKHLILPQILPSGGNQEKDRGWNGFPRKVIGQIHDGLDSREGGPPTRNKGGPSSCTSNHRYLRCPCLPGQNSRANVRPKLMQLAGPAGRVERAAPGLCDAQELQRTGEGFVLSTFTGCSGSLKSDRRMMTSFTTIHFTEMAWDFYVYQNSTKRTRKLSSLFSGPDSSISEGRIGM